jgi:alkyl hydroperoxide reductase subunit AhpC
MTAYKAAEQRFADLDAQVLGVSMDSPYCHMAWQEKELGELGFPLACDFYPHGAVAQQYGTLRLDPMPLPGLNNRVVYVVDKDGKIAFGKQYDLGEQPDIEDVFKVLRALQAVGRTAVGSTTGST